MSDEFKKHNKPSELTVIAKDIFSAGRFLLGALLPPFTRSADSELKTGITYYVRNEKAFLLAKHAIYGDSTIVPATVQLIGRTNGGFPLLKVENEYGSASFVMQTNWRGNKQSPIDIGLSSSESPELKDGVEFKVTDANKFIEKVKQAVDIVTNKSISITNREEVNSGSIVIKDGDVLVCNGFDVNGKLSFHLKSGEASKNTEITMSGSKGVMPENMGLECQKNKKLSRDDALVIALSHARPY